MVKLYVTDGTIRAFLCNLCCAHESVDASGTYLSLFTTVTCHAQRRCAAIAAMSRQSATRLPGQRPFTLNSACPYCAFCSALRQRSCKFSHNFRSCEQVLPFRFIVFFFCIFCVLSPASSPPWSRRDMIPTKSCRV